jgi:MFS family permease
MRTTNQSPTRGDLFGLRRSFVSLRTRNYRLYFFGQLVSMAGTWMQTVAQSFLVLHLTNSGTALGLTTAVRWLPMLVLGPVGGLLADRLDKQRVLYFTQTIQGLIAAVFATLIATDAIQLWMVYVLAAALGLVNVLDNPVRQSFISEMVPAGELGNAVTLNSVTVNLARVIGAAIGGLIVAAVGLAWCFGLNAVSFAAVLISLGMMHRDELFPAAPLARGKAQVREGLRYVRQTPELIVPLVMIAVVGAFTWEFPITLPLVARFTFHRGAGTYGLMASVMAIGAVAGGLFSASNKQTRAHSLAIAAVGWGIAIVAAAVAPTLPLELVALVFVGYGSISFNARAKTALQLSAAPSMRGRVMALWAIAWQGSTPIGGPIVGYIAQVTNPRISLIVGAIAALGSGLLAWPALRRIDRRHADQLERQSDVDDGRIGSDALASTSEP